MGITSSQPGLHLISEVFDLSGRIVASISDGHGRPATR
jgi:hypothetical protein